MSPGISFAAPSDQFGYQEVAKRRKRALLHGGAGLDRIEAGSGHWYAYCRSCDVLLDCLLCSKRLARAAPAVLSTVPFKVARGEDRGWAHDLLPKIIVGLIAPTQLVETKAV